MDYPTLKILHLTGLALTFMGLSGILAIEMTGEAPFSNWLARQACFTIGKEPSVNKANDPPEQKVKGSGSGVFKASLGLPR